MKQKTNFLQIALSDYHVGAIARSSKYTARSIVRGLGGRTFGRILEYGPGDGVITRELLKCLTPDGELIAVDANPRFLNILKSIDDSRLKLVHDTIQNISAVLAQKQSSIDLVVASIPFSLLKSTERAQIISNTFAALSDGGSF